jgi:hypothetical protein
VGGIKSVTALPASPAGVGGDLAVFLDSSDVNLRGIWGWDIAAGAWKFTRDGTNLIANSVTADKLAVSSLAAISANLGTVTSGAVILDAAGFIRGGQTYYNAGSGFWLGYSGGAYKLSLGNSTQGVRWDGVDLKLTGSVSAGQPSYNTGYGYFLGADGKFSIGDSSGQSITWDGSILTIGGKLSALAVDAVDTINLASDAVTVPTYITGAGVANEVVAVGYGSTYTREFTIATVSTDANGRGLVLIWMDGGELISNISSGTGSGYTIYLSHQLVRILDGVETAILSADPLDSTYPGITVNRSVSPTVLADQIGPGKMATYKYKTQVSAPGSANVNWTVGLNSFRAIFMDGKK